MYDPLHCFVSRLMCSLDVAIFPTEMKVRKRKKKCREKRKHTKSIYNKNKIPKKKSIKIFLSKSKWKNKKWLWMNVMLPRRLDELLKLQVQRWTRQQNHHRQRSYRPCANTSNIIYFLGCPTLKWHTKPKWLFNWYKWNNGISKAHND